MARDTAERHAWLLSAHSPEGAVTLCRRVTCGEVRLAAQGAHTGACDGAAWRASS